MTTAIQQFQEAGKNIEAGWKGVEAAGGATAEAGGRDRAGRRRPEERQLDRRPRQALSEQLGANKTKYEAAKQNLENAIQNYEAAATAANKLRSELKAKESALPSGNQMKVALTTMADVYHPGTFELGQATSQLALANLQVGHAGADRAARLGESLSKSWERPS